ncbi:hypothetical protein Q5424_05960 [Conexibacter sp. JD483]|uniref:hypothetical protein n=1 Tax=unclassified Conexibacter TaxID=2627773 RepID=UPI002726565C|nr:MULTISPECIES: hypothetical protein [unclassified Conexibacter]MDO8185127.1 hypothetical protein [Conexibacter sp. CPCC 205706]MDO8196837.1 hypothetical protein [Conexibacter sp. CPCC 205762]MDR9368613.1 hypothetical protein [Conexibacter sp. JD483]
MATALKLSLALLLIGSLLLAYLAPPPARRIDLRVRGFIVAIGLLCYAIAALALTAGSVLAGAIALLVASELVCTAGWLGRGESPGTDEDEGGGGGGGGGRGPKPPPRDWDWDWDSFEQAFRRYARDRVPSSR